MEELRVEFESFSGPLDLMLHLIKEKKLDIFDLDLNVLSDQYCLYISNIQNLHLEVAGEYLVVMSQLLEIKSRKMLPVKEEETEEDPKEALVKRLLEYQKFKEITETLFQSYEERAHRYSKPLTLIQTVQDDQLPIQANAYDLFKAMQKTLRRLQMIKPQERTLAVSEISIEDRTLEVRSRLMSLPKMFRFERLLEDCQNDIMKAIATFLSVLDLSKQHVMYFQVDKEGVIWLLKGEYHHD